jgi:hypothetical protein
MCFVARDQSSGCSQKQQIPLNVSAAEWRGIDFLLVLRGAEDRFAFWEFGSPGGAEPEEGIKVLDTSSTSKERRARTADGATNRHTPLVQPALACVATVNSDSGQYWCG